MSFSQNSSGRAPGFTFAEVLIAMLVLAIGAAATAYFVSQMRQSSSFTQNMSDGTALAQAKLEELAAVPYAQVAGGNDAVGNRLRTWTVTVTNGASKLVAVTVVWRDAGRHPHAVTLRSLVSQ